MALSNELISQFVKLTNNKEPPKKETIVYGTVVKQGNSDYVRLDGSDLVTPVSSTATVNDGERVTVLIKNHTAMVTGNLTSPAARTDDVKDIGNKISDFEIVIADKVSTDELDAEKGRIDDLVSDNILVKGKLIANEAALGEVTANNVIIKEKLTGHEAEFEELKTKKLDADEAEFKYASIGSLDVINQKVHNLQGDFGGFKDLSTESFKANDATIKKLQAEKLSTTEADMKFANIDFANIGQAAMEHFYAKSGLIKDVVVGNQSITGELVGVTIKGDLIEGNTIKAEKLVIRGSDGLYYKLNTDGITTEAEQTEYNSLDGTVIAAKSITASKINVGDLVAFGATIGGFTITDVSIYSGVKASANNSTLGIYVGNDGQFAFGDSNNFMRYYKDKDGEYKFEVAADNISFGSNKKYISKAVEATVVEYYLSTSASTLTGGSWSAQAPAWIKGKYMWSRTKTKHMDGAETTAVPVCIAGAEGQPGAPAWRVEVLSENGNIFKNGEISTVLGARVYEGETERTQEINAGKFRWTRKSKDAQGDYLWNQRHFGGTKEVTVTSADVQVRATFSCEILV